MTIMGYTPCQPCGGKGKTPDGDTCEHCLGKGLVPVDQPDASKKKPA